MEQFSRTELLIGKDSLKKLQKSSVTVIGLGAVGSYCVEALVRAGVGRITLVDFDIIRPSNINRHIWAFTSTLEKPKAEVAKARVLDINPKVKAEALKIFIDRETIQTLLADKPDIVVDAIDSLNPKAELLESCWKAQQPVISSMGAATRTDPFAIRVGDLMDTTVCPLAKRIRKMLRDRGVASGIACVYSTQVQDMRLVTAEAQPDENDFFRGRMRRQLGSLSTVTGMFGLLLAHVVIGRLLGKDWKSFGG
jgi:tRNA A37 threonylcarbamoyladenosine dehydratase